MPLQKIELPKEKFTFSDGQEVYLKPPTLLQIQSATKNAKGDEIEQAKNLLVDMSEGELNKEFLNALPIGEWMELSKMISGFMGVDVKN